jgi:hypothetical protein
MGLTQEQVDDLRATIEEGISTWWDRENTEALDALCAAAVEPVSLVGKRVRILVHNDSKALGVVTSHVPEYWHVETDEGFRYGRSREYIELVEEPF